ncbi:MAG TPA: PEP-CTERM sorting domain-containing protein [Fimbriimonadaceae bacterium]|nr:PEP-CTERM sorting domain-containing protein [Fimbriimonadaceae bacterium]
MRKTTLLALACLGATGAHAQFIAEIGINPPGTDNGSEYIEIQGTAGASLAGLAIIQIEGDAGAANPGNVDSVVNLGSFSFGSNGLLLVRDANTTIGAGPEAGTNVVVQDFAPDLENADAQTWMLVNGFSGAAGNDLDTNNDGVLDSTPWTSVIDAVGFGTTTAAFFQYAGQVGGTDMGINEGINFNDFEPDWLYRILNASLDAPFMWAAADLNSGTPWVLDPEERVGLPGYPGAVPLNRDVTTVDPGRINAGIVPEPATMCALALGAAALIRRRRQ